MRELVARRGEAEYARVRDEVGAARFDRGHFPAARRLFEQVATSDELQEFLTLPAYDLLVTESQRRIAIENRELRTKNARSRS